MVKENFLNLLQEIERLRDVEIAIFATYCFDHVFFENVLMRGLRRNNPGIIIIVLVDFEHYPKPTDFSESTGTEYLLLPVSKILFHPKLFLFLSDKKGVAYIGSHNLTLNGITHNLELTLRTEESPLIRDAIDFLVSIMNEVLGEKNSLNDTLAGYKEKFRPDKEGRLGIRLIHNIKHPILQTALDMLTKGMNRISDVVIFAPFFSSEKQLLEKISTSTGARRVNVCIQRNNHNLHVENLSGLPFVTMKEVIPKENRRMHSKFLIFKGKKRFALVGSPNFTGRH